jgi:hypothetical protein
VRILAPTIAKERITGTIEAVHPDSIVLDTADVAREQRLFFPVAVIADDYRRVSIPMRDVGHVERSQGRSRWLGGVRGGVRGALIVGLIAGVGSLSGRQGVTFQDFLQGFGAGAVLGAAVGAPLGYQTGVERWYDVPLPRRGGKPRVIVAESKSQEP